MENLEGVHFEKDKKEKAWQVSGPSVRMEVPSNFNDSEHEKWLNIEITAQARILDNDLIQMYGRGGHHTDKDPCLGVTYKARFYADGNTAWIKEITHPAYTHEKGNEKQDSIQEKWMGLKAIIYDVDKHVRLEIYTRDSDNGDWKIASTYDDKGDWKTDSADFDNHCGVSRDEIITESGGTDDHNIVTFRSDRQARWEFKSLSIREIVPPPPTS